MTNSEKMDRFGLSALAKDVDSGNTSMEHRTFEKFRQLIYDKSGITLGAQKVALVSARISKRMRTLGLAEHEEYLALILQDDSGIELVHLLDAISTNVTSFFRESQHFDLLTELLGRWRQEGMSRFRIWSAASSTGEEPYTIAMVAMEALRDARVDLKILATDISTRVLQHCQRGEYVESKVDPVPAPLRQKYFNKVRTPGDTLYTVTDDLKRLMTFRRLNLSTPPFPMKGPMDVVFCRNVMIYFDETVRRNLLKEILRVLRPGGYLMIGHSESIAANHSGFRLVKPSVYMKQ